MSLRVAVRHLSQGEWEQAHAIVQEDDTALGAWAHGIVHLYEGDLDNARYWYRQARRDFPASVDIAAEIHALTAALDDLA